MSAASLARCMTLGLGIALLAGCAHKGPPPLYVWESFPKMQYDTLLAGETQAMLRRRCSLA